MCVCVCVYVCACVMCVCVRACVCVCACVQSQVHSAMAVAVRMGRRPCEVGGMWLAVSGGNDCNINVYDVESALILTSLRAHEDCIGAIEFVGFGRVTTVATGADDGVVTVWALQPVFDPVYGSVADVDMNRDAPRISHSVLARQDVHPENWVTGIRFVPAPASPVHRGKHSASRPAGDWLITSGGDCVIVGSLASTLEPLFRVSGHRGIISGLHVVLGGRYLVSTSEWDGGATVDDDDDGGGGGISELTSEVVVWRLDEPNTMCCNRLVGAQRRATASAASDDIVVVCTLQGMHVWEPPSSAE
jgi:WD40 repeat protein